jgi:restriction endonuclease S subunit
LGVGCYGIYDFGCFDPLCLTAILNSRFLSYYFQIKFKDKHLAGGYLAINKSTIEELPLVDISAKFQKILALLAEQILSAKAANTKADTSSLESRIDKMVYQLYGLTEEEIKMIEGVTEEKKT